MANPERDFTQKMADWCIEELRYKAKILKETGAVVVYNGDVVKSDTAVPEATKAALQAAARSLEDVPEVYKDYHPGSDGLVLDLVHPSLFPLIYGRTRVLEDRLLGLDDCVENCGTGTVVPIRSATETAGDYGQESSTPRYGNITRPGSQPFGTHFQWLPCDVEISGENGHAKCVAAMI